MKYCKLILMSFFVSLFWNFHSIGLESTYVYCVNEDKSWHWLTDTSNKYYSVNGRWESWEQTRDSVDYYFQYFILNNYHNNIKEIKNLCQNKFGKILPQPANSSQSEWYVFAKDSNNFLGGVLDIYVNSGRQGITDLDLLKFTITIQK